MPPKRKAAQSAKANIERWNMLNAHHSSGGDEGESNEMVNKKAEMKSKMERLTRETIILRQEILVLKDTVANVVRQNETILNLIGEQQVMISGIFKVESKANSAYTGKFPLQAQEDLDAIEEEIGDENRDKLVSTVQSLITPGGLLRNLNAVLSLDICLDYNIEGIHNKKRLQNYPKFMDILYRATMRNGWTQKLFLDDLRKGLKHMKNRHFKAICLLRKKEREGRNSMVATTTSSSEINVSNDATDITYDGAENEDDDGEEDHGVEIDNVDLLTTIKKDYDLPI